jgi:hypothetical protein
MGQSIDTFQWKDHLLQYWGKNGSAEQKAALAKVDFDVRTPSLSLSVFLVLSYA